MGSHFVTPGQLGQLRFETVMPWGKTRKFDQYSVSPSSIWNDDAYEAPASEDINVWGAQGGDEFLGLGQTTVPAPTAAKPASEPPAEGMSTAAKVGVAVVLGGLVALAWDAWNAPAGPRFN